MLIVNSEDKGKTALTGIAREETEIKNKKIFKNGELNKQNQVQQSYEKIIERRKYINFLNRQNPQLKTYKVDILLIFFKRASFTSFLLMHPRSNAFQRDFLPTKLHIPLFMVICQIVLELSELIDLLYKEYKKENNFTRTKTESALHQHYPASAVLCIKFGWLCWPSSPPK